MKNLFNPKWLVAVNTLPICLLTFIFYQEYSVINSLLEPENIRYWLIFGSSLVGLTAVNLLYASALIYKKREVSGYYGLFILLAYIAWIYLYILHSDTIIPFQVPQWMFSGNIFIYAGTFLMPTLAYCMLLLVAVCTRNPEKRAAWKSFLLVILIPSAFYFFFTTLLPLWNITYTSFIEHTLVICTIITTLAFLFFICRGVYIIAAKQSKRWKKFELLWKIPIVLILPLTGLIANNGLLDGGFIGDNIFGDFNHPGFYVLAAINGVLLCIPSLPGKKAKLVLYLARCVTFSYSTYFFIVFLPFLPFSIIAVTIAGLGFLMLAPLLLFLIHTNQLHADFFRLKETYSSKRLLFWGIVGTLVIPAILTSSFIGDRRTLHQALEYAYEPNYSKEYRINKKAFEKTLNTIRSQKRSNSILFAEHYIPYLTSFYNRIVLDNLTLSDSKIETLDYLYLGEIPYNSLVKPDEKEQGDAQVIITQAKADSRYDHSSGSWISSIDLEISNTTDRRLLEFVAEFTLPDGCWISDYYLYVEGRKEKGMLSEKKAAMWVYSQITNEKKDPGILHYDTGNEIVFKVFPFDRNETRKTGIEFIHKEPFTLQIDEHLLSLGNAQEGEPARIIEIDNGNAMYIPASAKENLRTTTRRPYFHFIADASAESEKYREDFITVTDHLITDFPILAEGARITLTDAYPKTYSISDSWKQVYRNQSANGGFFLDRALRQALINSNGSDTYPVFIVLTNEIEFSVMDKNYANLQYLYPESPYMYVANEFGGLVAHSLLHQTYQQVPDSLAMFPPLTTEVRVYTDSQGKNNYLSQEATSQIIVKENIHPRKQEIREKDWESGLWMQAYWISQQLHPETSSTGWIDLAKMSFSSRIMTPVTSYIVVENEAQKAALERKQREVMRGEKSLDTGGNETQRMSEPESYLLLLLLIPFLWVVNRRQRA